MSLKIINNDKCVFQGSHDDSESAAPEGADSSGQPAGTGGQLHFRGTKQEDRVPGHAADSCCQPECQQEGGRKSGACVSDVVGSSGQYVAISYW